MERVKYRQLHMGGDVSITAHCRNEECGREAIRAAFARIAELEQILSDYRPTSELCKLCQRAGTGPVPISTELFTVLSTAQQIAEASNGAFDVTIGALTHFWRSASNESQIDSMHVPKHLKDLVGWRNLLLDSSSQTAELRLPGMMLDLGAIAKGYACDEALRVLSRHGVASALVEAGGEVVASGAPPDASSWSVMDSSGQRMALCHSAISTSGDSEQFIQVGSVRHSHVLDSKSGLGWTHRRSTVVRADSGMIADALATAISCLDEATGQALADRFGAVILTSALLQK